MESAASVNGTSGGKAGAGRLAKGVLWNLAGQGIPLVVAVFCIPLLIRGIGLDRFGFLTLAWALIGYFSLLDLGLGRAVTKLISQRIGEGRSAETGEILFTAAMLMGGLGVIGGVSVALMTDWLSSSGLNVPTALQAEARLTCYALALTIPFVTTGSAFLGYLAALHRFDLTNSIRIPVGLLNYLAPLAVAQFTTHLAAVVSVVIATRIASWALYLWFSFRELRAAGIRPGVRTAHVKPLFSFGAWITVSNVLSPLMTYLDRFVIASVAAVGVVAYYTTPYEAISRMWILPTALITVLFPAFSYTNATDERELKPLFVRALKMIALTLFPLTLLVVTFARDLLDLWLGAEFSSQAYVVLQLLAVGVFVNSLAQVPSTLMQSVGRPDVSAKLHLLEVPIYVGLLVVLTQNFGIVGAAIAWVARMAGDGLAVAWLAARHVPSARLGGRGYVWLASALLLFAGGALSQQTAPRVAFVALVLAGFTWLALTRFTTSDERRMLVKSLTSRGRPR